MNEIDLQNTENETSHHSLIIRYWRDSLGELRGQLINPVTNKMFPFASAVGMHQVLDRAIEETPYEIEEDEKGT